MPAAIGQSHLTRMLILARALQQVGGEVTFGFAKYHQLLEREGFSFFIVADVSVIDFGSNVFAVYTPSFVERCVEEELRAIENFRPDVIVGDMRLTAAISSRVTGKPFVSIVNGYMTDYFDPVDVIKPEQQSRAGHAIASFFGRRIQAAQKRKLAGPFRTVAQRHGIKDLVSLYDFLKGDLTLIADLPEFCPLDHLPPSYRYVGPLIWEGGGQTLPDYLEARDRSRPLIYATTGNTGSALLLQLVLEAFRDDPVFDVVVTTGEYLQPAQVPRAANIHVERFIPGSAVLQQCVAAIHCGGNGTTYQVIGQGVPAVVVPFNNDQAINAWMIKRRRLGIPLSPSGLTGDQLRSAVMQAMQDSEIRESLRKFQFLVQNADGPGSAAREILSFISEGNSP